MGPVALFIITTFSLWRLALVITIDEGPFSIFQKARQRIDPMKATWYGRGIRCEMCVSFWLGLATAIIYWWLGFIGPTMLVQWWLGLSGAVVFIDAKARG